VFGLIGLYNNLFRLRIDVFSKTPIPPLDKDNLNNLDKPYQYKIVWLIFVASHSAKYHVGLMTKVTGYFLYQFVNIVDELTKISIFITVS
jgi:hypothetical protein